MSTFVMSYTKLNRISYILLMIGGGGIKQLKVTTHLVVEAREGD